MPLFALLLACQNWLCTVPHVSPVSLPPPIACSAASACVSQAVPLRLGSPRSWSHLLTPCDAASATASLWRGPPHPRWPRRYLAAMDVPCRNGFLTGRIEGRQINVAVDSAVVDLQASFIYLEV
ncbi:unnamed protein product [Schistocephalus solidus]|uniref:Secreted protein n=1 Tax=Schistocephalus solidus TaxID=70667 RepID=A0A183SDJ6_SCHSO|nr:unnamed protein product [Schistocephalus solidus]